MPLLAAELASLLGTVRRPGDFFAAGTAELLAPSLDIEGVGPVALPLPEQAGRIIGVAEAAPYGRGEKTLIDPAVRRCWQIGPDRVRLGGRHWARTLPYGLVCAKNQASYERRAKQRIEDVENLRILG